MKYHSPIRLITLTMAATLEGFETGEVSRHVKLLAAMCEVV